MRGCGALVESSQYFPDKGWPALRPTLRQALSQQWAAVLDAAYSPDLMVNPVNPQGAGAVLILNTTGDPATPLAWAQSLHDQIKNSTLVIVPAQGHIVSSQNGCAEDTLVAFLMRGLLPPDRVFTRANR